jgi:putative ABC transport system permease protein
MLNYYVKLGLHNLCRSPALTALMVLTLAVGVAASVATLTILHVMSGDPLPAKSKRLLAPVIDNGDREGYVPGISHVHRQFTYRDAINLLRSGQGERRTTYYSVTLPVEPQQKGLPNFLAKGLAATRDFAAMFDLPFRHGHIWSAQEDTSGANVVVLSRQKAQMLFGDADPVGKKVSLAGQTFNVTGVLNDWRPLPRFYDLMGARGTVAGGEDFLIPFATAIRMELGHAGNMSCEGSREPGFQGVLDSECTWLQFWFELSPQVRRDELQSFLNQYAAEQRRLGRFQRDEPPRLFNLMEWMQELKVVGNDNRLAAWLAFGFLALCTVNTIGLLLAKLSRRNAEIGVRRALGASRSDVMQQLLAESTILGLSGGILGVVLAFGALKLVAMQSDDMSLVARMDWPMLGVAFLLSVTASIVASLLPVWRASLVNPALQLKSQ